LVHFLLAIVLSVLCWWKASDSPFGSFSFGHCVVCPSLMKGFWFSLWYLHFFSMQIYVLKCVFMKCSFLGI
jgi:hypothetical protein